MKYLFKAKTTKPVIIEANNLEMAKRYYYENGNVIINRRKAKK